MVYSKQLPAMRIISIILCTVQKHNSLAGIIPALMPDKSLLQLELLKRLENDRLEKLKSLQMELEYISKIKENLTETPVLGQKRKLTTFQPVEDSRLDPIIETFSIKSDWNQIVSELEAVSKTYTLRKVYSTLSTSSSSSSQIISSIESDSKGQFFATGGVPKLLTIYDFKTFQIVRQIETPAKISCIGWNLFSNDKLFSSDYNGSLSLHNTVSGQVIASWTEHEKRIWSLHTSPIDPHRILTGSDDCHVKVWSERSRKSVLSLNIRANVCSVRFHPTDSNIIAASAADHRVFLFDLRKTNRPLASVKDHKKSVSYVRFTEDAHLLSAATDCTLKLWSCNGSAIEPIRTYSGHVNEKNFVGLSVKNGLFAVGSEDNSVYIYQTCTSSPILKYTIPNNCPLTGDELPSEPSCFVSSVCWARGTESNILLVANSLGQVHALEIN